MDLNYQLAKLLTEGNSLRGCSRILKMTYRSTYLKFLWLSKQARIEKLKCKLTAVELQFDEMETIHHTKCKPLSIALLVNESYQILEAQVAEMPAKGKLARFSVQKYGVRADERDAKMRFAFEAVTARILEPPERILSDAKSSYRKFAQSFFPEAKYEIHSRAKKERHRERLHEKLVKKAFDPLFQLNQRCAKLRSDIKRLTRRSWCTTKKPENLQAHLDLYVMMQFGFLQS